MSIDSLVRSRIDNLHTIAHAIAVPKSVYAQVTDMQHRDVRDHFGFRVVENALLPENMVVWLDAKGNVILVQVI